MYFIINSFKIRIQYNNLKYLGHYINIYDIIKIFMILYKY